MMLSIKFMTFQPYGFQIFIPLIGYLLSQRLDSSTISLYHSLKSSVFLTFVSGISIQQFNPKRSDVFKDTGMN